MKKVAVITGASRGIGREIALSFAKEGYIVVINYNHSELLASDLLAETTEVGGEALLIKADVAKENEVNNMFKEIINKYGKIDVLINNAGISQQKLFTDVSGDEWDALFGVNVKGVFNCSKCAAKDMIFRKSGVIINISSIWGMVGASCEVCYSASKSAVIGFTKALAKELGPSNIRVNCIAPGVIDTDMNKMLTQEERESLKQETPLGTIGSAKDVAHMALFLASDAASFITGQIISPNGGFVI